MYNSSPFLDLKTVNYSGSQISSQHPYAEEFIGKPHVWTVDMTNGTEVQDTLRAILRTEVVSGEQTELR